MGTVLALLQQSLLLVGMRAAGEVGDLYLVQDALTVFNQLIDSLALEEILVYTQDKMIVNLLANKQTYTVGPGGEIDIPRPVRIDDANWRDEQSVSPALEIPITKMSKQEYHSLSVPELSSTIPTRFYYEPSSPLGLLFFWPKPSQQRKLTTWVWHPWSNTYVLTDIIAFPPGYERMLVHNLAVELGQQPGARLNESTIRIAEESKARLASVNLAPPLLALPLGLSMHGRGGAYNYLTDNT